MTTRVPSDSEESGRETKRTKAASMDDPAALCELLQRVNNRVFGLESRVEELEYQLEVRTRTSKYWTASAYVRCESGF